MMIGQEEGAESGDVDIDQPIDSQPSVQDEEVNQPRKDEETTQKDQVEVVRFRDIFENPVLVSGLLIFVLAIWFFTTRGRGVLDKSGRPIGMSLRASLPVLGWYFVVMPMILPVVVVLIYGQQSEDYFKTVNHAALLYWLGHLVTLPVLVLWWLGRGVDRRYQPHPDEGAWRVPNLLDDVCLVKAQERGPRSWLYSIIFAFPALFITYLVIAFTNIFSAWVKLVVTGVPSSEVSHETLKMLEQSSTLDGWTLLVIAAVVFAAPIFEEVIFRGTLQSLVRSMSGSSWIAIILTSAFFASRHIGVAAPEALPGLFVLALGMGAAYVWTGRLITPIIMHMLFNAGNILLLLILSGMQA